MDIQTVVYILVTVGLILFLAYLSYHIVQSHFEIVKYIEKKNEPYIIYIDMTDPHRTIIRVTRG